MEMKIARKSNKNTIFSGQITAYITRVEDISKIKPTQINLEKHQKKMDSV